MGDFSDSDEISSGLNDDEEEEEDEDEGADSLKYHADDYDDDTVF